MTNLPQTETLLTCKIKSILFFIFCVPLAYLYVKWFNMTYTIFNSHLFKKRAFWVSLQRQTGPKLAHNSHRKGLFIPVQQLGGNQWIFPSKISITIGVKNPIFGRALTEITDNELIIKIFVSCSPTILENHSTY